MKFEWIGKFFFKTSIQQIEKKNIKKVKLLHKNKKNNGEKADCCSNTLFSFYFKFGAKKITPQKHLFFLLHFCFSVTNITSRV